MSRWIEAADDVLLQFDDVGVRPRAPIESPYSLLSQLVPVSVLWTTPCSKRRLRALLTDEWCRSTTCAISAFRRPGLSASSKTFIISCCNAERREAACLFLCSPTGITSVTLSHYGYIVPRGIAKRNRDRFRRSRFSVLEIQFNRRPSLNAGSWQPRTEPGFSRLPAVKAGNIFPKRECGQPKWTPMSRHKIRSA